MNTNLAPLAQTLEGLGVPRLDAMRSALETYDAIQAMATGRDQRETGPIHLMSLDEIRRELTLRTLGAMEGPVGGAAYGMQMALMAEVRGLFIDAVPDIIASLRPAFDEAAAGVYTAVKAGIRAGMTANDVIALSPKAITAWRNLPPFVDRLDTLASARVQISRDLDLAPTISKAEEALGLRVDYGSCFTDPEAGLIGGYSSATNVSDRWLRLATLSECRLRLNDPDEVYLMLFGDGDSQGWIVSASSVVVTDDKRRQLILYTDTWVPSWVDDEQLTALIEQELVRPATPDQEKPADRYPLS